jgi:serine/threonine protein kinase
MEFEKIGKYKILGEIGQGAMGVVYKAHDPILNREVAIKTISASLGADDDLRKRFHREAQAAARLNHPNIITVFDFGEEHGKIYMAMELLEGTDLKDIMTSGQLATLDDKLAIMEQILDGLAFAHAKEIVHRDLKPGNIHIQPNGQIKIMDFGLARLGSSEMTQAGVVMGTPNYMSPEQVLGEKVDSRSDIFAMGAVFYECLTGHKPFEAESMHGVLFQVVHKDPQAIRKWAPDLPPVLVQIVEKCLVKDKTKRFQNAGELREAVMVARQALLQGRISEATLDMESGKVFFDAEEFVDEGGEPVAERPKSWPPQKPDGQWVEGTVALDQAPLDETQEDTAKPASRSHPTLSGRNRTQPNRQRTQRGIPAPVPPSRTPLYLGGAVLVVGLAVGIGLWFANRPILDPTFNLLLNSELRNVRRDLDGKQYKETIDGAQKIIELAALETRKAANPMAARTLTEVRQVLAEARSSLGKIEDAATGAENAFAKGDLELASTKLTELLQLDPKHQVAVKLGPQLNVQFRSKAEEARQTMAQARNEADRLEGASTASDFAKAQAIAREGETALTKSEFAVATRSFLEARDTFDRVRRGIEAKLEEKLKSDAAAAQKAAEDGKRQMLAARSTVEGLDGARSNAEFAKAQGLVKEAETLESKSDFAAATRAYLDARDYYARSKTSIENKIAADRLAAERAKAADADARARADADARAKADADARAKADAELKAKTDAAERARLAELDAKFAPLRRALNARTTRVEGPPVKSRASGLEEAGPPSPDFTGSVDFETAAAVAPGEHYSIKVYLKNTGQKAMRLKEIQVQERVNAQGSPETVAPPAAAKEIAVGDRALIYETSGTMPADVTSWVLQVKAIGAGKESCTNTLALAQKR